MFLDLMLYFGKNYLCNPRIYLIYFWYTLYTWTWTVWTPCIQELKVFRGKVMFVVFVWVTLWKENKISFVFNQLLPNQIFEFEWDQIKFIDSLCLDSFRSSFSQFSSWLYIQIYRLEYLDIFYSFGYLDVFYV